MIRFHRVRRRRGELTVRIVGPGSGTFDLWFRVRGASPSASPEGLVAAVLPVAMEAGEPVGAPGPVDRAFLHGSAQWQELFTAWYPGRLAPVPLRARTRRRTRRRARAVACFFTAGVDSFYSTLRHRHRLDALVFVHGFDVPLTKLPALREEVTLGVRAAAHGLGLPLVEVETNLHDWSDAMGSPWGTTYHGAALATVAHILAGSFGEVVIGATHSHADLFPWGSHPLTDPLLSGDRMQLTHDGCDVDRVQKTRAVAESDVALGHLRVCWENRDGTYNCGTCRKCLRTMIALRIAGRLESCPTLPHEIDLGAVRTMPLADVNTLARHAELVDHLRGLGTEPELLEACLDDLRRHDPAATHWGHDWTAVLSRLWES